MKLRMKPTGFTLVELLVVIAIIALLMSMLLPALGKAQQQAWKTVCKSNLRQMVISAIYYADDNDGKFPQRGAFSGASTFYAWNAGEQGGPYAEVTDHRYFWNGYLDAYVLKQRGVASPEDHAPKAMFCPAASETFIGYGNTWPAPDGYYSTGYAYFSMGKIQEGAAPTGVNYDWITIAEMPTRMSDPGHLPLFGDILTEYPEEMMAQYGSPAMFRIVMHLTRGKAREWVEVDDDDAEGVNNARCDGSVQWYAMNATEIFWSSSGSNWKEYNYWGRPY